VPDDAVGVLPNAVRCVQCIVRPFQRFDAVGAKSKRLELLTFTRAPRRRQNRDRLQAAT
jgi:hypothetical protein